MIRGSRRARAIALVVALSVLVSATGSDSVAAQASHATERAAAARAPEAVMIEGPIDPTDLTLVDGVLYLVANADGDPVRRLWRSDGTNEGTYPIDACRTILVCGAPRPPRSSSIDPLQPVGGLLYFVTAEGLWRSDGTSAGTVVLAKDADVPGDPRRSAVSPRLERLRQRAERDRLHDDVCDVLPIGQLVYVVASRDCMDPYPRQLWVTDGSRRGSRMLIRRFDADPDVLTASSAKVGHRLVFPASNADGSVTWVTDGTRTGTRVLKASARGRPWRHSYSSPVRVGDRAIFAADDGVHGSELWVTDGTTRGTRLVRDIRRGRRGSDPWLGDRWPDEPVPVLADSLLFITDDGVHGRELWLSDGTPEGTRMVRDIGPGRRALRLPGWDPTIADGRAYFVADDGIHGQELWVTDGTDSGTRMVTDLPDGPDAPRATTVTAWDGLALWVVRETDGRSALWRSDGSPDGTYGLAALVTEPSEADCYMEDSSVMSTERLLYLATPTHSRSCGLWRTDGTVEGTFALDLGGDEPRWLAEDGGTLYVFASHGDAQRLWRTDGTQAGTSLVSGDGPVELEVTDRGPFFVAGDGSRDVTECWSSSCHLWFLPAHPQASPTADITDVVSPGPARPPTVKRTDLAALFPSMVDGRPVTVTEREGAAWIASYDPADPDDAAAIAALDHFADGLDREIDDISVAYALARVKGRPAAITAVRVGGVRPGDLVDAVIPFLFADTVEPARVSKSIAGKRVIRVTDAAIPGAYPRYVYPVGDTVWLVEADARYLDEIIGALP